MCFIVDAPSIFSFLWSVSGCSIAYMTLQILGKPVRYVHATGKRNEDLQVSTHATQTLSDMAACSITLSLTGAASLAATAVARQHYSVKALHSSSYWFPSVQLRSTTQSHTILVCTCEHIANTIPSSTCNVCYTRPDSNVCTTHGGLSVAPRHAKSLHPLAPFLLTHI